MILLREIMNFTCIHMNADLCRQYLMWNSSPYWDYWHKYLNLRYKWEVTDAALPPPGISSRMWLYHSHTDSVKDEYSGLFGYIVVTVKGMLYSLAMF